MTPPADPAFAGRWCAGSATGSSRSHPGARNDTAECKTLPPPAQPTQGAAPSVAAGWKLELHITPTHAGLAPDHCLSRNCEGTFSHLQTVPYEAREPDEGAPKTRAN